MKPKKTTRKVKKITVTLIITSEGMSITSDDAKVICASSIKMNNSYQGIYQFELTPKKK